MDDHDWYRTAATALVVGVIGPLFWMGVGKFDLWVKSTRFGQRMLRLGDRINALPGRFLARRKATKTAKKLGGARRIGKE